MLHVGILHFVCSAQGSSEQSSNLEACVHIKWGNDPVIPAISTS